MGIDKRYDAILGMIEKVLGNGITNNHQLDILLYRLLPKNYKGTYALDAFKPDMLKKSYDCLILNNKKQNQVGEHWIAIIRYKDETYVYDSFDRTKQLFLYENYWLLDGIRNLSLYDGDNADQKINEENCGQRCSAFLFMCCYYKISPIKLKINI